MRQPTRKPTRRRIGAVLSVALAVMVVVAGAGLAATSVKPYVEPVGDQYQVRALFSVDDKVPLLGGAAGQQYRMVGIPDGLGAHPNGDGTSTLYMNHELGFTALSEPVVGGPKNRGAIVSQWLLDADGDPVAAGAPTTGSMPRTPCLGRPGGRQRGPDAPPAGPVLLGFLAGPANGFDRPIYLTNEESGGAESFDGRGGQSVAIFDNELHTLPALGRFNKENSVVQPTQGTQTVIFPTEDGPATLDNQLYMYVGKRTGRPGPRSCRATGSTTARCMSSARSTRPATARSFTSGSVTGEWVPIPDAEALTDTQLEAASDAAGR